MRAGKNGAMKFFLFSILITTSIVLFKKATVFGKIKELNPPRSLFSDTEKDYACEKAGSRLTDKYTGDYDEEAGDAKESLSKAQQSLIDFARDNSYRNIKPYLKRVAIYITFLCIAVIFIILWITYWSCFCCNCCLFSKVEEPSKNLQLTFFLISAFCNLLVIIFSIVVLSLISPFFSRINGLFCSILTLLDHINDGLSPHYPPHASEWVGLENIYKKFKVSEVEYGQINFTYIDETYDQAKEKCELPGADCVCNITNIDIIKKGFDIIFKNIFGDLVFQDEIADILEEIKVINRTGIDSGDDIYDFLHDYANRHIKNSCIAIFSLTLCFGILGLVFLGLYYFLKKDVFRIVYIVIWNIDMLFLILAIVVSVVYGVVGYVFTDGVQVFHFILSRTNIESDDPLLFPSKKSFIADIIEECAYGDGHFLDIIGEEILNVNEELQSIYQDEIDEISNNTCMDEARDSIVKFFQALKDASGEILIIISNLFNIKCSFMNNDKNIMLNEVESTGKRGVVLSTFQFFIAIFMGISIFTGICLVHKYNFKDEFPHGNSDVKINQNSSHDNQENTNKSINYLNNNTGNTN